MGRQPVDRQLRSGKVLSPPLLNWSRRPIFVCAEGDGAAGNMPALPTHAEEVKDGIVWPRYQVVR